MIASVSFEQTVYAAPPAKFEAGTPHVAGAVGLAAALEYLETVGFDRIAAHEHDLTRYGAAALEAVPGVRLVGTARDKASVLSFVLEGVHAHDVGTILDHHGVAVRAGHHCAMPVMQRFGLPATVRASLALYNTREEIDVLAAAVRAAREVFA
jgi:cysteine desulfurase/selenocysteine lyase